MGRTTARPMTADELRAAGAVCSVETMARFLQIGRSKAYDLISTGELPAEIKVLRLGSVTRISVESLIRWADGAAREAS